MGNRDCANCFHRKPVLKDDGTWTAECEKWDCEFQDRSDMISRRELVQKIDKERKYLVGRGQTAAEHILVKHFRNLVDNKE